MNERYTPSPELESLQKLSENKEISKTPGSVEFLIYELAQNCHTSRDFFYILASFPNLSTFAKEYIIKRSSLHFTFQETVELLSKSDFQRIEDNDVNEHYPYEEALIEKTQSFDMSEIPEDFLKRVDIPFHIKKHIFTKMNPIDIGRFIDFTLKYDIGPALREILITKVKKISLEEANTMIQRPDLGHNQKYYIYKALSPLQVTPELIESLKQREQRGDDGEYQYHICEACEMFELDETNIHYFETEKLQFGRIEMLAKKVKAISWGDFAKQVLSNRKIGINIKNILLQKVICSNFGELLVCIRYLGSIKNMQISAFIEHHPKINWDHNTEAFFQDIERDKNGDMDIFHRYISRIVQKIDIPQEYYRDALAVLKNIKNTKLQRILADCFRFQTPFFLLESIPEVSLEERKRNISKMNMRQRKYFSEKDNGELPQKRTFVFYYRKWQGDYAPHYQVFIELLQKYILGGKSRIWNDFRIVLRHHPQYSHDGNIPFETKDVSFFEREGFRASTSIFADTLSLNHGTFENIPGTFHIGAIAASTDKFKVSHLNRETSPIIGLIPLNYYNSLGARHEHARFLDRSELQLGFPIETDIETLCKILLEGIQKTEDAILEHIRDPKDRVGDILEG